MKYLVFVNNSIQGPFTIKEIFEKNLISNDLLVCPAELSANKPSSWYFAKELLEFGPYLEYNGKQVIVKDFYSDDFNFDSQDTDLSEFKEDLETRDYSLDLEEIIENEGKNFKDEKKFKDNKESVFGERLQSFEASIKRLDEKLNKAFEIINRYEKILKDRESIIKKLENEILEIKNSREKFKVNLEKNKFSENIDLNLTDAKESFVKKNESNTISENFISKLESKIEDENIKSHSYNEVSDSFETENNFIFEKNLDSFKSNIVENNTVYENVLKNDSFEINKDNDVNMEKEEVVKNEVFHNRDRNIDLEFKSLNLDEDKKNVFRDTLNVVLESKKEIKDSDLGEEKNNIFDLKDEYVKIEPISLTEATKLDETSEVLNNVEITHSFFMSSSPLEKSIPFQVAEINLETVNTNLEIVKSNIEPIQKIDVELDNNNDKNKIIIENQNFSQTNKDLELEKEPVKIDEAFKLSESQKFEVNELEKEQRVREEKKAIINEKKEEDKKTFYDQIKESSFKEKKKISKLILFTTFSGVFFVFTLIYILKNGTDGSFLTTSSVSNNFSQVSFKSSDSQKVETIKENKSQSQKEENLEDVTISKINESVKEAVDLVKNYNLGEGKGTIERWLSNTIASGIKGKEEWNATYLTKNIFVVQYRFLRFKGEPIVYLFEVDIEKKQIIRGINNNAINLLAGRDKSKKEEESYNIVSKKIKGHIENDDDMF
ncbi:MAG: hypothetical protein N2446_00930 [Elusimicrobiales bacterium]|nr:hypothetical protein [Elusimicrobiales bacterium]